MKKILSVLSVALIGLLVFTSCSVGENKNSKIKVVTTIFPQYDFAKKIGGDKVDVKLLLKPGAESHTYEPTPKDMKEIGESDLFIYTGGENDTWIEDISDGAEENKNFKKIKLLDMVKTVEEEQVEGMQAEEEEDEEENEHEIDEHVWTSPKNAILISQKIKDELVAKDKENKSYYEENFAKLKKDLEKLDKDFKEVVANGKRKTILFGDRFPFRYFADEYNLKYYAAFSGCSTDSEVSAQTVAFLIDKVKKEKLPVVFSIEMSSEKIANTISEATGAKKLVFHSCHNVSKEDREKEVSYVDLMRRNVENLKKALN